MGVVSRARAKLPPSGDYLEKDDLVRAQEPMGIKSCIFDPNGSSYGPRWVLSIVPWFDDQDEPQGLLTFGSNPTRNPMFEDFQAQIEENHDEPIGPVVVVKEKSQKGFRFYTLADWSENGAVEAPVVVAPAPEPTPTPARARPARPAASAPDPKAQTPASTPTATPGEEPKKRGRPRKTETPKDAGTAATTANVAPVKPAEGTAAQSPVANVPLNIGAAICPDCHQEVKGRILPDDTGKLFIIHPHCPATGRAGVVEVVEVA